MKQNPYYSWQNVVWVLALVGAAACEVPPSENLDGICGNGEVEGQEQCDDGNTEPGDGCSASCWNEAPAAECGNGRIEYGEECDDGNTIAGDGCDSDCRAGDAPCTDCGTLRLNWPRADGTTGEVLLGWIENGAKTPTVELSDLRTGGLLERFEPRQQPDGSWIVPLAGPPVSGQIVEVRIGSTRVLEWSDTK